MGTTFKGKEGKEREWEGEGKERQGGWKGRRGEEVEGRIWPTQKFWCGAPCEYYYMLVQYTTTTTTAVTTRPILCHSMFFIM